MEKPTIPEEVPMPEELADALRVITGERPSSFQEEFKPNTSIYPKFDGAGFAGESAQDEFLRAKDPVDKKIKFTNNKTEVLDLTDITQKEKYEKILDLVSDPESGVILAEELKEPHILLDATAPFGYRAIVVIRTTKPKAYLKEKDTGYTVQHKKSRGKKEEVAD